MQCSVCSHIRRMEQFAHLQIDGDELDSNFGSGSESYDSEPDDEALEEQEDLDAEAVAASQAPAKGPAKQPGEEFVQHRRLRTLHKSHFSHRDLMACGRKCPEEVYDRFESEPAFEWPRCKHCFGS